MDEATARARLERMTQASRFPTLTEDEMDELIELARRPDLDGNPPDAPAWAGAFDLNSAAAEGWRWKAAKVAGDESVTADGATFGADTYKGCLAMAAQYDRAPKYDPDATTSAGYGSVEVVGPNGRTLTRARQLLGADTVANLGETP